MVWDKGTYEPEGDLPPEEQLVRGEIKVVLHGKKLRGGFVFLRPGGRFVERAGKKNWLLIKHRDEYAEPPWRIDSSALDRSVLTGRTLKEIAENRPAKKRASA